MAYKQLMWSEEFDRLFGLSCLIGLRREPGGAIAEDQWPKARRELPDPRLEPVPLIVLYGELDSTHKAVIWCDTREDAEVILAAAATLQDATRADVYVIFNLEVQRALRALITWGVNPTLQQLAQTFMAQMAVQVARMQVVMHLLAQAMDGNTTIHPNLAAEMALTLGAYYPNVSVLLPDDADLRLIETAGSTGDQSDAGFNQAAEILRQLTGNQDAQLDSAFILKMIYALGLA